MYSRELDQLTDEELARLEQVAIDLELEGVAPANIITVALTSFGDYIYSKA